MSKQMRRKAKPAVTGIGRSTNPIHMVRMLAMDEFPLYRLLALVRNIFRGLPVTTGPVKVTDVHRAKARMLRTALAEAATQAGRLYPVQPLACACGQVLQTPEEMDEHLWEAFVPDNDIGLDGKTHAELDRTWLLERLAEPGDVGGGGDTEASH